MNIESPTSTIERKLQELMAPEPGGYFLVDVKVNPGNNIKVFIDADQGASIDKLVSFNRRLSRWIEETGLFPADNFSLEVSSPGIDEPLKLHRQFVKNVGRTIELTKTDETQLIGKLLSVDETSLIVEEEKGKNKKKEIIQHTVSLDNVKSITVQIKF
jgi:ribosome maturation factor RimP